MALRLGRKGEIADSEKAVGYRLPHDLNQSLKRHNGQLVAGARPAGGTLIPCGFRLPSLSGMLEEWEEHRAISDDLGDERDFGSRQSVRETILPPCGLDANRRGYRWQ